MAPGHVPTKFLRAGEVGYICASIKQVKDARVGDTVTLDKDPTEEALPGYKKVQSMVYCGIYPAEGEKYEGVKDALEKLQVNDAAFCSSRRRLRLSASVSAAASWAFSTWRSSSSV